MTIQKRNKFVEKYIPLVRVAVGCFVSKARIHGFIVNHDQWENLYSAGLFGLIKAAESINIVDYPHNRSQEAYLFIRVRGAIIDYLRTFQSSRDNGKNHRILEDTEWALNFKMGYFPTPKEVCTELGWLLQKYYRVRKASSQSPSL